MKKQLGADFDVPVAPSDTPLEPVDANIQTQSQDTNEIVEQETAPIIQEKPQPKPKDESQVLTESIEAQNLYQLAEIHFKKGRYIGYKKCVDACREIIEKYPSTVEAQKAKEMLRQLPSDKRKLYGITEEELN
jgi:TolA-binding protein